MRSYAFAGTAFLLPVLLLSVHEDPGDPLLSAETRTVASASVLQDKAKAKIKYLSAKGCKNCHNTKENGSAYDKWKSAPHANAWATLATDQAKEIGKKLGIEDPQKDERCFKCHVTAHGVAKRYRKKIKEKDSVQCEVCHGPGDPHMKKRMVAAGSGDYDPDKYTPVPAGEIEVSPGPDLCLTCHNKESPTYKPFCFKERMAKIRHLDPRKKRSEAEMKKLEDTCYPDCPKCAKEKKADADKKGEADKK